MEAPNRLENLQNGFEDQASNLKPTIPMLVNINNQLPVGQLGKLQLSWFLSKVFEIEAS